jgi:hypothetical protein
MKPVALACLALLTVAACEKRGDTDDIETGARHSADTIVTERQMQDTAVINYDTTVSVDTAHKRGTRPVDTDTVRP